MVRKVVVSARQRRSADTSRARAVTKGIAGNADIDYDGVQLAELTNRSRKQLKTTAFAIPSKRAYPIHDLAHARNALARVSQFGTPAEKAKVRAAVARKFPNIGKAKASKTRGGK